MELYLDLQKAAATYTGGRTPKSSEQAGAENKASYNKEVSGVANGSAAYDDPDKGKKWQHSEEDEAEQEAEHQARNKDAQDKNLVPTPEEAGTVKKAFGVSALDMVKSLNTGLRDTLDLNKLSSSEVEFLHLIKGFSYEQIDRGGITIMGKDRAGFSDFLCAKAQLSLDKLYRR